MRGKQYIYICCVAVCLCTSLFNFSAHWIVIEYSFEGGRHKFYQAQTLVHGIELIFIPSLYLLRWYIYVKKIWKFKLATHYSETVPLFNLFSVWFCESRDHQKKNPKKSTWLLCCSRCSDNCVWSATFYGDQHYNYYSDLEHCNKNRVLLKIARDNIFHRINGFNYNNDKMSNNVLLYWNVFEW